MSKMLVTMTELALLVLILALLVLIIAGTGILIERWTAAKPVPCEAVEVHADGCGTDMECEEWAQVEQSVGRVEI